MWNVECENVEWNEEVQCWAATATTAAAATLPLMQKANKSKNRIDKVTWQCQINETKREINYKITHSKHNKNGWVRLWMAHRKKRGEMASSYLLK